MLTPALGRLFLDLDKIPERERSRYEDALHRELLEMAQRLQPRSSQRLLSALAVRQAIESSPALQVQVDLDLGGPDVTRLRCNKADCPNKRVR